MLCLRDEFISFPVFRSWSSYALPDKDNALSLYLTDNAVKVAVAPDTLAGEIASTVAFSGEWLHIVAIWKSTEGIKLYLNGTVIATNVFDTARDALQGGGAVVLGQVSELINLQEDYPILTIIN